MALAAKFLTPSREDYLRWEADSPVKYEYLDGQIVAMAGAGERHLRITLNAAVRLRQTARGTRCGVFISDLKLRIEATNAFYYPEVMLVCAEDDHPLYKRRPCLVVEVMSPSTAAIDRREKWLAYRTLESLRCYLLVDAESRHAEYWLRAENGGWQPGTLDENELLRADCPPLDVSICLDDLYEDVVGLNGGMV